MLRRAKRLQKYFDKYCDQENLNTMKLSSDEWRQVDYLLTILQPFYRYTKAISISKDITIYYVFRLYNELFEHIETSIKRIRRKRVLWRNEMLNALNHASDKLSQYYQMTAESDLEHLYAHGTILAPQNKLHYFKEHPDWQDHPYHLEYASSLRQRMHAYQDPQHDRTLAKIQQPPSSNLVMSLMSRSKDYNASLPVQLGQDELDLYCSTGTYSHIYFNFYFDRAGIDSATTQRRWGCILARGNSGKIIKCNIQFCQLLHEIYCPFLQAGREWNDCSILVAISAIIAGDR